MIDGVCLYKLKQIPDERGSVLHMLRNDDVAFTQFGEVYFSEIFPGSIKAWKYHHNQTQNLAVPVGRIRFVIFDGRESSSTCGDIDIIELGRPDAYSRLTIPPGLWYGFSCISEEAGLLVNCSDLTHDPNESETKELNDCSIPYKW
jgi:dTDP-4-dehydrorhamnose 3,5-epimerase